MKKNFVVLCIFFLSISAKAYVFSFQENWVAAYLRTTGGPSNMGSSAYEDTSGDTTTFSDEVEYNFSGELGFSFLLSDQTALRIGLEGLQSKNITGEGTSTTFDQPNMSVESKLTSFNPTINLEINFGGQGNLRYYSFGGASYAQVKVSNSYDLTALGAGEYVGQSDQYKEVWYGKSLAYQVGAGFEMHMVDNVTFNLEAGYRMMKISDLFHDSAGDVIRAGGSIPVAKGEQVISNDGRNIELDMSGFFVGILFRFYIPPLN